MSKSITVSFQDGSTHLYEDVPDNVTQEQANARALQDFPNQKIADITHSDMSDLSAMDKTAGTLSATYNLGNELLSSPIGHAIEAGGAALYGGNKLVEAAKAMRGAEPTAPVAPPAPQKPPMGFVDTNAPRMGPVNPQAPQMARGMGQGAQMARAAAPAQPQSWMGRAVQMGNQAMQEAAPAFRSAGQTAGRALGTVADLAARYNPAIVGAQLATFSPELGPHVPKSGPYRGMEINPRTGRPWSPEELSAIANGRY